MPETENNNRLDVVIDITLDDQTKAIDFFETLLILEEGMPCQYWIQLGQRRLIPALQELIITFQAEKKSQLSYSLPPIDFPQELIDMESAKAGSKTPRIPLGTKKKWFEKNLVLLKAISELEEFVYLSSDAVLLQNSWLKKLHSSTKKCALPVQGYARKLKTEKELISCGWSSVGWYHGRTLRRLPLMKMFQERISNPWQGMSPPGEPWKPSFCLAQDWLSAFDTPLGYVLFALYFQKQTGKEDPIAWDLKCGEQVYNLVQQNRPDESTAHPIDIVDKDSIILLEIGVPIMARKKLQQHYSAAAQKASTSSQSNLNRIQNLPLSGPKYNLIGNNHRKLAIDDLHNMFRGERCFIIGNGPSLNQTNLNKLKDEYTIGLNRIYLNVEKMGFQPTFLCATNPNVLRQFGPDIDQVDSVKFLRYHNEYIKNRWNAFFMEHTGFHSFIKDLREFKWCEGCTVTYCAMQVAFFLGFETVILVGVDHHFQDSGKPHQLVTSNSQDANHFHPEYFGKGVEWQYPDLAGSEVSYRVADSEFKRDGRIILDATVGGSLKIFKKCQFDSLFG